MSTAIQRGIQKMRTCSCGRPKPFGSTTKCDHWIENKNPLNPQVKQIGFSAVAEVCKSCIHFKKVDHEGRARYERLHTVCSNHIAETVFKPHWPACHNFQPRPEKKSGGG